MLNMPVNSLKSIGCEAWQFKGPEWSHWQKTKETANKCPERTETE